MAERPDTRQLALEDCEALSRRISDVLDANDPIEEAYRLPMVPPKPESKAKIDGVLKQLGLLKGALV